MKNFEKPTSILQARQLRRTVLSAAALLSGIFLLATCAGGAAPVPRETGKSYQLVLLHTNDHHGTPLPVSGTGGLAERATYIESVREQNANVLLLDAGDVNTGSALSNMFAAEPDIRAYGMMGYDAVAMGNHEFDGSRDKLNGQIKLADSLGVPFFASNIRAGFRPLGGREYIVKDYDGFRVGIFTLTTLRTHEIAGSAGTFSGLSFKDEISTARDIAGRLRDREKADIVIALTHMGDRKESDSHVTSVELAAAVPDIDIIVDGHSHSNFEAPMSFGKTRIVTAGSRGSHVGTADISIIDGQIAQFSWQAVPVTGFAADADVADMLSPFIDGADASLKEVIGRASGPFVFENNSPRYGETAIGDMVSDSLVWYLRNVSKQDVDFAFVNGGNVRAELPAGELTREHILTVLPFDNILTVASLTGAQLQEVFDFIATIPQGNGGFPQFSSDVRYTLNVPEKTISDLTIGGAPLDPAKTYRFGIHEFLLGGGDGYTALTKANILFNTSMLLPDVVIEYIKAAGGEITPSTDGRMTVTGGAR
jgi:5'-nucleotidase/UDP-sugar diphosphatase